jgi:hypothetical protein
VPTTITGTFEAWHRGKRLPKLCWKITVKFHPPIFVQKLKDRARLKDLTASLCKQVGTPIHRRVEAYRRLRSKKDSPRS